MSEFDPAAIAWLARRCATRDLTLPQAQKVFALAYAADALMLAGGNATRAARRAGIDYVTLHRLVRGTREALGAEEGEP